MERVRVRVIDAITQGLDRIVYFVTTDPKYAGCILGHTYFEDIQPTARNLQPGAETSITVDENALRRVQV